LALQLIEERLDDFRVPMPDVENPETAQTVEVLAAVDGAEGVGPGIGPFYNRGSMLQVGRLAILEKPGIDVIAERGDGFARNPFRFFRCDLALRDQLQRVVCILVNCSFRCDSFSPQRAVLSGVRLPVWPL
jgi:hypothetical protein